MRADTEDLFDRIDAAVFSGDEFLSDAARKEFRDYMARWERGLKAHEETAKELEKENEHASDPQSHSKRRRR